MQPADFNHSLLTPWTACVWQLMHQPLTHGNSRDNVCCFMPLKLLCSKHKQKLIHNLVKINTFCMAPPHSHRQADCCSKLHPRRTCYCSKYWLWYFPGKEAWNHTVPEVIGSSLLFPSLGKLLLILQGSPPLSSLSWNPWGRIKPISSVVSETSEENSIIIFRRSGCNFLFTCLLNGRGQVKQKDSLQR